MYVNVVCMATATLSKPTKTCMKGGKQATRPEYEARRLCKGRGKGRKIIQPDFARQRIVTYNFFFFFPSLAGSDAAGSNAFSHYWANIQKTPLNHLCRRTRCVVLQETSNLGWQLTGVFALRSVLGSWCSGVLIQPRERV